MGFKKMNKEFSFADVVLESSKKHNRSLKNSPVKLPFGTHLTRVTPCVRIVVA